MSVMTALSAARGAIAAGKKTGEIGRFLVA